MIVWVLNWSQAVLCLGQWTCKIGRGLLNIWLRVVFILKRGLIGREVLSNVRLVLVINKRSALFHVWLWKFLVVRKRPIQSRLNWIYLLIQVLLVFWRYCLSFIIWLIKFLNGLGKLIFEYCTSLAFPHYFVVQSVSVLTCWSLLVFVNRQFYTSYSLIIHIPWIGSVYV